MKKKNSAQQLEVNNCSGKTTQLPGNLHGPCNLLRRNQLIDHTGREKNKIITIHQQQFAYKITGTNL